MSRTHTGSKGPGYDHPDTLRRDQRAQDRADYKDVIAVEPDDTCSGCRLCLCVKCGSHMIAINVVNGVVEDYAPYVVCISCEHREDAGTAPIGGE